MAHAGQEIEGPGGFRLRLIETAAAGGEFDFAGFLAEFRAEFRPTAS